MKVNLSRTQITFIAVSASVIAIGIVCLFPHWFDAHAGVAAWVQAIGAIAIVFATAWIAGLSFAEERRRREESERRLWESVGMMSERCMDCLHEVVKAAQPAANPNTALLDKYRPSDLDAPLDGLATVPLYQLGDVQMVQAVIAMRRVMARVRTELNEQYASLTSASVTRGLNVDALCRYKTEAFNALASIMRLTYGSAAEEKLRRF